MYKYCNLMFLKSQSLKSMHTDGFVNYVYLHVHLSCPYMDFSKDAVNRDMLAHYSWSGSSMK